MVAYNEAKRLAKETTEFPRTIIQKVQSNISSDSAIELMRPHQLTQVINRIRNEFVGRGNFATRADIVLPEELTKTLKIGTIVALKILIESSYFQQS